MSIAVNKPVTGLAKVIVMALNLNITNPVVALVITNMIINSVGASQNIAKPNL